MRVLGKIVVLIAVALFASPAIRAECSFVTNLQGGQVPTNADLRFEECTEAGLAEALASYLTREDPPAAGEALQVIQTLEAGYREANRRTKFKELSESLKARVATSYLAFELPENPQDGFDLLWNLKERLQNRETQEIEKQIEAGQAPAGQAIRFLMHRINEQIKADHDLRGYLDLLGMTLLGLILVNLVFLGYLAVPKFSRQRGKDAPSPAELAFFEVIEQRVAATEETISVLARTVNDVKGEIAGEMARQLAQHDADWSSRLADATSQVPPPSMPDLGPLIREVEALKASQSTAATAGNNGSTASSSIVLEREILKEAWRKFQKNEEIRSVLSNAWDERWLRVREPLLRQLPQLVPEDLKPTFEAAVAPAKDFDTLMSKISFVSKLADDKSNISPLENEAQELMRLRELTGLLTMIQTSNLVADRLNFRLEPWIVDCFLGFADLFLQRYQKAQMEKKENQLQPGYEIVRRILKIADLEPVDLTLGVTRFDSARHIGRSTASDPSVDSGVILGVIRNGFIRGGQQVIRQPEVIVNRVA